MRKDDPALFQQLKQSDIDEIDTEYAKVVPRFTSSNGKVRKDSCAKNLRQRAEAVAMGKLYPTFYGYASSIHHDDIGGFAAQISTGKFQTEIAPSFHAIRDALIIGHQSVIVVIDNFNDVAALGLADEIKVAVRGVPESLGWVAGACIHMAPRRRLSGRWAIYTTTAAMAKPAQRHTEKSPC